MADNILKGIIKIEAPGVEQTTTKVSSGVSKVDQSLKRLSTSTNQASGTLINFGRVAQDIPFGIIGIANNLNPLFESFQRLKQTTGSTGSAFKALARDLTGAGGLGFAISIASSALILLTNGFQSFSRKAREAKDESDAFADSLKQINKEVAAEIARVDVLVAFIQKETASRQQRTNAIKELQQIAPEYFATLDAEKTTVNELTAAYGRFTAGIQKSVEARVLSKQLETIIQTRLELEKMIKGGQEQIVMNGKLVTVQNAFYGTAQEVSEIQDKINNAKREELLISQRIASLAPPKEVFKAPPEIKIKPDKLKIEPSKVELGDIKNFDFQNELDKKLLGRIIKIPVEFSLETPNSSAGTERLGSDGVLKTMTDKLKGLSDIVQGTLTPVFENFFNTIANGGNAFKAFAQSAAQALTGLITKLATAALLSIILSSLGGGIGVAIGAQGNKFADIFKLLSGFGGARASGGPVQGGKSYLVGENGPEIFRPGISGDIIPNSGLRSFAMASGGSYTLRLRGNDLTAAIAANLRANFRLR